MDGQCAEMPVDGRSRMRRLSQQMPKLVIPSQTNDSNMCLLPQNQVTREQVIEEGKELFCNFVVEEFDKEGLETPNIFDEILSHGTPEGYANPSYAKVGQELRLLGDDFARYKAKERERVRRRASQIGVREEMTEEEFKDLLKETFVDGITKERIMILFVFCSDVLMAALKRGAATGLRLVKQFFTWSIHFIVEKVCTWVQTNGGWERVYNKSVQYLQYAALGVCVGLICYFGVRKVLRMRS